MSLFVIKEVHFLGRLFGVFLFHFSCHWILELYDHVHLVGMGSIIWG